MKRKGAISRVAGTGDESGSQERSLMDLPPHLQEKVVCSIAASIKYQIPANVLLAIAEKEGGKPGQWVRNSNGTFDVGAMQFNTTYLKDLSRYGITPDHIASSGYYAYDLTSWCVQLHLKNDQGNI